MARTRLDQQLQQLHDQIVQMGNRVEQAVAHALEALHQQDQSLCRSVISSDPLIDQTRVQIEQTAFRVLTLQQPLGGRDLRLLTTALTIAGNLERIGDGAAGMATLLVRMQPLRGQPMPDIEIKAQAPTASRVRTISEPALMEELLDLGKEAHTLLQATIHAFASHSVQAARHFWEEDDLVDVRYHMVRHYLMAALEGMSAIQALQHDALILQRITYLLWIAHKLERIADHCTNICECIVFIEEGERRPFQV